MIIDPRLILPSPRTGDTFEGFLFDCDGTLVDSMPVHFVAWNAGLRDAGATYDLTEEDFYGWGGIHEADIVGMLNERHGAAVDPNAVIEHKAKHFAKEMAGLKPILPVTEFAASLHGKAALAVVSGSPREHVTECLKVTGINHLFTSIVTPEDVAPGRGKPHPDMFLLAAEQLGVEATKCVVFEDAKSGIDGAEAAQMATVFVARDCR